MVRSIVDELTERVKGLKALPEVVSRVVSLQLDETSAREMAGVIEKDAGLSARLLKMANSAYFGLSGDVSTVRMAVTVLGVRLVKNLVLCTSMLDLFPRNGFALGSFAIHWQYNFTVAAASRLLARKTKYPDPEDAFTAGLLQHIGLLFMLTTSSDLYKEVLDRTPEGEFASPEDEREILGMDHTEAGLILAEHLKLPDILRAPMRFHHNPEKLPEKISKTIRHLVRVVWLADLIAQVFVLTDKTDRLAEVFDTAESWFGLDKKALADIMGTTAHEVSQVVRSFLLDIEPPKSYLEVLQEANLELGKEALRLLGADRERPEDKDV